MCVNSKKFSEQKQSVRTCVYRTQYSLTKIINSYYHLSVFVIEALLLHNFYVAHAVEVKHFF